MYIETTFYIIIKDILLNMNTIVVTCSPFYIVFIFIYLYKVYIETTIYIMSIIINTNYEYNSCYM